MNWNPSIFNTGFTTTNLWVTCYPFIIFNNFYPPRLKWFDNWLTKSLIPFQQTFLYHLPLGLIALLAFIGFIELLELTD